MQYINKRRIRHITRKILPDRTDEQHNVVLQRQLSIHRKTKTKAKLLNYFGFGGTCRGPRAPPYGSATGSLQYRRVTDRRTDRCLATA